ncbi:hypothetical protein BJF77_12055 [Kocuria sp. CNJ-770]|uniref:hypothetical protein n=1 Tax=Kocuria sp. CNJ-770 TaxID=1904964 RepID=UPI00095C09AE|nr:hypothetical protein [Kocuria sp. CNJ-770]OLT08692.1 hypothetical protein BJF77_12055 [Kocuria sp. CNJ-770]
MGGKKKQVQDQRQGKAGKSKTIERTPEPNVTDMRIQWDATLLDHAVSSDDSCAWTWAVEPHQLQEALQFLSALPQKTWGELESERTGGRDRHRKHHQQDVASLCREAQDRLYQHLGDDSPDTLFRFRYNGTGRIWGIRDRALFQILWLDTEHQVYPTERG